MSETTRGFRGEYFFLSNFYVSPVEIDFAGETLIFQTGEHAFQGMKIAAATDQTDKLARLRVLANDPNPAIAKAWGRSLPLDLIKMEYHGRGRHASARSR